MFSRISLKIIQHTRLRTHSASDYHRLSSSFLFRNSITNITTKKTFHSTPITLNKKFVYNLSECSIPVGFAELSNSSNVSNCKQNNLLLIIAVCAVFCIINYQDEQYKKLEEFDNLARKVLNEEEFNNLIKKCSIDDDDDDY